MFIKFSGFVLGFLFLFLSVSVDAQYLTRSGKNIVNEKGEVVILRGMGLGNWMLQEPYMMDYVGGAVSQGDFKNKLENLIGSEKTNDFFENRIDFKTVLVPYKSDPSWIPSKIKEMKKTLDRKEIPESNINCESCIYLASSSTLT